jgi:acetylornithine aminotransferase/acetylornithine/N-succinyldiaminopimelate aminotransferase
MNRQQEMIEASSNLLMNNYGPPMRAMVRGSGARIWDADGGEYIDFFAGFGGGGVTGHCHPAIVEAIRTQAGELLGHGNFFTNGPQIDLARRITSRAFGGKVFFCHSGGEANECALKLVRRAAGEGRYKIISFENCFHGRTMGGLSLTPPPKQKSFEPMLPGNVMVPFNDLDAVRAAVDDETAGIFVEPIQGEGGVNEPTVEFMQGLRALCDEKGLLLVCDEVWTGPARTGAWFAHQLYSITPDVMTVAKALGGGTPMAVCVAGPGCSDVLGPGTHGCTMGGNPLCAAAGAATMKLIEDEDLLTAARRKGEQIRDLLKTAEIPCLKAVRGRGLMLGLEIDRPANEVFRAAMDRGLLICYAGSDVIRLAPPLTIPESDLREGMEILTELLRA